MFKINHQGYVCATFIVPFRVYSTISSYLSPMFSRVICIFFIFSVSFNSYGQGEDICDAVLTITRDAPNKFRNIRGIQLGSNRNATMWESGIKVPGSIGDRFVLSMGLFYECAFFQSKKKGDIAPVYEKYKTLLNDCLLHEGYTLSLHPNFFPGMGAYKKLVFITEKTNTSNTDNIPPHITLEATYNKTAGIYTLVLFIFEH